jgi:hypothetical protein
MATILTKVRPPYRFHTLFNVGVTNLGSAKLCLCKAVFLTGRGTSEVFINI